MAAKRYLHDRNYAGSATFQVPSLQAHPDSQTKMPAVNDQKNQRRALSVGQLALVLFGLIAPVLTFLLAVSRFPDPVKIFILITLAAGYAVICFWSLKRSYTEGHVGEPADAAPEVDEGFEAMGEASSFFGSSLKPADLFRLVSSRVGQVFPFSSSALFIQNEHGTSLEIVQADGKNGDALVDLQLPMEGGLAGMAWLSGEVESDIDLRLERQAMPPEAVEGMRSAVAIPLLHEKQPFAVMTLYLDKPIAVDEQLHQTLTSIGEQIAPLFLSSISFERSVSNALTDTLTSLPNERAFFMVLENQLAESHRFRNERPLTVLSIDIKNFAEANQNFGFAAGDRMLAFAAEHLTSQLRKMDFLSRAANDEFLIILPTASEKFAGEIIQRIRDRFATVVFAPSESEEMKIWLNFGWATFWQDGETAEQLLQTARVRKQQAKAEEPSKVLWFPKEYVN